jgi:hypothetical protein
VGLSWRSFRRVRPLNHVTAFLLFRNLPFMRDFFLEFATGLLVHQNSDSSFSFLGSAAPFRNRHTAVTAAHCVPTELEEDLALVLNGQPWKINDTVRHPESNVAVVIAEAQVEDDFLKHHVFDAPPPALISGGDFEAFGFLSDGPLVDDRPVGRLLKGHFQRYFGYESPIGYKYFAGEMSIPAPAGFSGGPIVYLNQRNILCGIATANVESYAILDQIEEKVSEDVTTRYESRRVLSYGLAAMVSGFTTWLDEIVPKGIETPSKKSSH